MKITQYCEIPNVLGESCPIIKNGTQYNAYLSVTATVIRDKDRYGLEYFEILGMGCFMRDLKNVSNWHFYRQGGTDLAIQVKHSLISLITQHAITLAKELPDREWENEYGY